MKPNPALAKLAGALRRGVNFILLILALSFLAVFGLQFPHPEKWDSWRLVIFLKESTAPLLGFLDSILEWPEAARYFPLGIALAIWMIKLVADSQLYSLHRQLSKPARTRAPAGAPLTSTTTMAPHALGTGMGTGTGTAIELATIPPDSERAREELLRRYREIEELLKSGKRKHCTFLSIDVVASTQMKEGHADTAVTVSFRAYEDMLKKVFRQYGAWKQAWTPDGVMICFLQRELAVGAAQRILQNLEHFNATYNHLRVPFRVRSGIHEGEVPVYEDTNLERVADRVIDIAGHLQKQANANTLWVSEEVFKQLQDKSDFQPLNRVVDGYKVFGWSPEPAGLAEEATFVGEVSPATIGVAAGAGTGAGQSASTSAAFSPPAGALASQGRISRYEIIEELGRGAMGAVYKARDPQIGRTVAIKVILTSNLSPSDLQEFKQRFYREAQAAGKMSHPGIVTIHDIGENEAGQPYLVMEYVEGVPLDKLGGSDAPEYAGGVATVSESNKKIVKFEHATNIAIQVAEALNYAHERGVIHRDIKPANILVTPDWRTKILDFGVAQLAGTQLTRAGQLIGTPAFMSPEQFTGGGVDGRSDIFSLGTVFYWMVTGENPFAADTLTAVAYRVAQTSPAPARKLNPQLPAAADQLLQRCLAKNPDQRYPTGKALAADLHALKGGRPLEVGGSPLA